MRQSMIRFIVVLFALVQTSCFDNVDSENKTVAASTGPVSAITSADFAGAAKAINKVTGIEISWVPSTQAVSGYKVYRVQGKNLVLLATLPNNVKAYIDGAIWWGAVYSYVVRAVDTAGLEETNRKQVSALAWAGIQKIEATSRTSLKVHFETLTAIADEVRIYLRPARGDDAKTLVATGSGSDLEIPIENLKSGFRYKISAQAYVSSLQKEDGNEIEFEYSTNSYGYHSGTDSGDGPKWNNVINIRAFGESPGTEPHPSDPDKQPKDRLVELAFQSFTGQPPSAEYVVIRTQEGRPINTSTSKNCTEQDLDSCRACELTGLGTLRCKDRMTAPSPARYRYTMALVHDDGEESWVEDLPTELADQFSVLVPIPPANMVLVQRDAVNYEMCQFMNKTSDPKNFNRCDYTGTGAVPYSTGHNKPPLNLPTSYYDFGYNLFVDRYGLGCNWTGLADGGMCGPGATPGHCAGTSAPDPSVGVLGNVYWYLAYSTYGSNVCFVKTPTGWRNFESLQASPPANASTLFANSVTNNPSRKKPKHVGNYMLSIAAANELCNNQLDANYGQKRIPRRREYIAMDAWALLPQEPYSMTATAASNLRSHITDLHDATNGYRCFQSTQTTDLYAPDLASILDGTSKVARVNIAGSPYGAGDIMGSSLTADCETRYGIRTAVDYLLPVSDAHIYQPSPVAQVLGMISPFDNGNRDLVADISGGQTGYKILISNLTASYGYFSTYLHSSSNVHQFVNVPLGLPVFLSSSSTYLAKSLMPTTPYTTFNIPTQVGYDGINHNWVIGRFGSYGFPTGYQGWYSHPLCVLPAE